VGTPAGDERIGKVQRAVDTWVAQMVDFTGNNRLLFYRELKVGTLNLTSQVDYSEEQVEALCSGSQVDSPSLVEPIDTAYEKEGGRVAAKKAHEDLLADTGRRLKAIYSKGTQNLEERGIGTTFLADGALTWENDAGLAIPNAPVLLSPLEIKPLSPAATHFRIRPTDEPEINPTLVVYLAEQQGIDIDADELVESSRDAKGTIQRDVIMNGLLKQCAALSGVTLLESVVIGNFTYSKLPMVQDLNANVDLLAENELVAAIAGVDDAITSIRNSNPTTIEPWEVEAEDPRDDFLVLDADSSQHVALKRALRGESLVIQGPPGTGKSQTIANLIASLTANGKNVLFVAEKGAAIDAVAKNLEKVGLDDLMMDLHGQAVSKKHVAKLLQAALNTLTKVQAPDVEETVNNLVRSRERLADYDKALHGDDGPFATSYFEASVLSYKASNSVAQPDIPPEALRFLTKSSIDEAERWLIRLADLGRGEMLRQGNPWATSSIRVTEAADTAMKRLTLLRDSLNALGREQIAFYEALGSKEEDNFAVVHDAIDISQSYREQASKFTNDSSTVDLDKLHASLAPAEQGAASRFCATLFNSKYRAAKKLLKAIVISDDKISVSAGRAQVESLIERGHVFQGRFGSTPRSVDHESLARALSEIESTIQELRMPPGVDVEGSSTSTVRDSVETLQEYSDWAFLMPEINNLEELLAGFHLREVAQELLVRDVAPELLAEAFRRSCYAAIARQLLLMTPDLVSFNATAHERTLTEFQESDRSFMSASAARVRRAIGEHARDERNTHPKQDQLVVAEAQKNSRHLSVRQMLDRAPNVIGALKPCWAMSPLAVSRLLPVRNDFFDVVIFDEASQVLPADAVPAIMRAKQVIVAGDTRQLPPTTFFASGDFDDDYDDEEEEDFSLTQGFESILDVMNAVLPNPAWLQWHYRSRDERLINFSNVHIYDSLLRTFPGVAGEGCIRKVTASGMESTVDKAVSIVLDHVRERPDRSLGVITTSAKMARAIEDQVFSHVRALFSSERTGADRFFDPSNDERFFVKNIETVQGDERDDIVLAVHLERSSDGRVYNRLGPLNQEGGERRLNVAVTRARRSVTLCSNFGFDDLAPSRFKRHGAALLRDYTKYAETGGNDLGAAAADKPELNAFEIDVRDRLVAAGMKLTPQFGVAGYFIDFVAYHPSDLNRPVLAIEADGASYHSSPTARDRDRLRQQVLEGLGWTFHRIWSTEWFANPTVEVERALQSWELAIAASDDEAEAPSQRQARDDASTPGSTTADLDLAPPRQSLPIRVVDGTKIDAYPMSELVQLIEWIESDGKLRVDDDLIAIAMAELGYRRKGPVIKKRLSEAISIVRRRNL